jgi:hypothetical protein
MKPIHWGTALVALAGLDLLFRREESLIGQLFKALG